MNTHEKYVQDLRSRLGCRIDVENGSDEVRRILSQPIPEMGGHTLEAFIRDLYSQVHGADGMERMIALEQRVLKLEKRQKLLTWCAKRIRRMLRQGGARHINARH